MIAVDWGSSSLRAFRLAADGKILERRQAALGILKCGSGFDAVLSRQIEGWDDKLVVLVGMIGSRQGWLEVPYVECPATISNVAAGMRKVDAPTLPGRIVWIVPGLLDGAGTRNSAEVLRGEETQLFGLMGRLDAQRHVVCLPGTHSKWAMVKDGCVESFTTAMTGELFELLCKHSLLGRLMTERGDTIDPSACEQGIVRAREPGGLLHHLFSVRTSGLLGTLEPRQLASYLSGLLIAHEVLDSACGEDLRGQLVHLVGSPALLEPYSFVLRKLGITPELHDEALLAAGAHQLTMQLGRLQTSAEARQS